jgi:branched-chain amino acid aminotransferase
MVNLDWANLPFGYIKTNFNVRCYYKNGSWGNIEVTDSEKIDMHMAATCLHYGQEAFEGLKAYRGKDNKIRIFRIEENAHRMTLTAEYIRMAQPPVELFTEMVKKVVEVNVDFVPPYGTGATLYIRPLLIGTEAQVGVKASHEYLLIMFVTPVGPYYKSGFTPIDVVIERETDRAAPRGTGHIKVGGNYAASLISQEKAYKQGFSAVLYLDACEKRYIDEAGTANFFAIKNNTYITPESHSILPSITNKSLIQLAEHIGMKVERRKIDINELPSFEETGACGTAAVISPIDKVVDPDNNVTYQYCKNGKPGPASVKLYELLRGIQFGDKDDIFNWVTIL